MLSSAIVAQMAQQRPVDFRGTTEIMKEIIGRSLGL